MGQDKLRRFAELHTFPNVIEADFEDAYGKKHPVMSNWHTRFGNFNPVTLELGCGKGEYTVSLARIFNQKNFIGVDIKGNRMWVGAGDALKAKLQNVQFLRTRIEFIEAFFAPAEVDEIWITFPDPQMQSNRRKKRLTSPNFLNRYKKFLKPGGKVHLKTDSSFLYKYTKAVIEANNLTKIVDTNNLYQSEYIDLTFGVKTYYEQMFLKQGKAITYLCFTLDNATIIEEPIIDDKQFL